MSLKQANLNDHAPSSPRGFPVVGVGASAGGLETFKQFLSSLSAETGMAFIFIQHLDPKHESLSGDILSRSTAMPVVEIKDGMLVRSNHVYVITPNVSLQVSGGAFRLQPRSDVRGVQTVIDTFFNSLAKEYRELAVGVVLSGSGSDGTAGLLAIQAEGGFTFSQTPATAKYEGMPQSAVASGGVDLTLTSGAIAEELTRIARHRFTFPDKPKTSLQEIFRLLRQVCHVDFTEYKAHTIQRRLERRMALHGMGDLRAYVQFLSKNPDQVQALYADFLIHVTGFFRDPDAFDALARVALPKLLADRPPGQAFRIWVPGCSTGEEAYSIALLLMETLGERVAEIPIQIFASDISEQAIHQARLGVYPDTISRDVSPERLARFFTKADSGHYKVTRELRDVCLFSRHDVTADPPFSKLDLISCRNLLIYFTASLQKQVIPNFHYALVPGGLLWLGRSETIGGFSNLFALDDKPNKVYVRRNAPLQTKQQFPVSTYASGRVAQKSHRPSVPAAPGLQTLVDQTLESAYPGVLIDEDLQILHFRGRTVPFLEPAAGIAGFQLLKMAREEFIPDLKMLIHAAQTQNAPVKKEGLSFREGRRVVTFTLKVLPVKKAAAAEGRLFFVLFESTVPAARGEAQAYATSQDLHRSLIEKFEATQSDLTTVNAELQSTNEEFQSSNEELETVKEELQSSNEELTTVNDELKCRSVDQVNLNNDLINLLGSVEIPILMLGSDHRIRRFTPLAGKALNLIAADVGRPISDLHLNFTSPGIDLSLDTLVTEVQATKAVKEIEVQDREGRWFRLQIRPYKTGDDRIDGVVLALVDIDGLKQSLKVVKQARVETEKANHGKDLFLATLSHELRTPLTSILGWAQMLRRSPADSEKLKKGIVIIEESAKTQAQLIDDLLDVSRIVAGKLALEFQEVNPGTVVRTAIESVRSLAESRGITVETTADPALGTVMADPVRLQQIIWNLVTNAVKFSLPGARVQVKLWPTGDRVLIQVKDSGKGVGPEFLPYIFDRFSQADGSSARIHGGLGLGLAIVRNLVELHGGSVHAESDGEMQGATFTVSLPIKSSQPMPEPSACLAPEKMNEIRLDGIRVLIVDDERNTREAFTEILSSYGAQTCAAASSSEAIRCLQKFKPDIMMSDIAMPEEDGYHLIQRVRELPPGEGRDIPLVAVTAYAGADDVKRVLSSGFQAHLAKPLDSRRLAEVISRLVRMEVPRAS